MRNPYDDEVRNPFEGDDADLKNPWGDAPAEKKSAPAKAKPRRATKTTKKKAD